MNIILKIKEFFDNLLVKEYSYYDKLISAGLGECQAADIYALCDNVKASDNVKNVLAQSIMCGYVDKDAFRTMYVESCRMFSKRKEVEMIEAIHMTKFKPITINYFLKLLDNLTMLSDKQIQEISKAAVDISVILNIHPIFCLNGIINMLPCGWEEYKKDLNKCRRWLFDNQQSYPFSITKQDMLY